MKIKENKKNKLKELKKKEIKNMTNEELKYIIENDHSLVTGERIEYSCELFKRAIKSNDFSDFTLLKIR